MIPMFIRGGWRAAFGALLISTLVACGGGSDTCVDVTGGNACAGNGSGGGTQVTATDLVVVLDTSRIPNDGSQTVTATITALDANRNVLPSAPVTVKADGNAVVSASGTVTNAQGVITAVIGLGSDNSNRTINFTVTSGALSRVASISVTDASGVQGVVAQEIVLTLSAPTIANSGNETVVATVIALGANRNVLAGVPVAVAVNGNAFAAPAGSVTDAQGRLTATVGIGADRTNRTVTVTATSGALSKSLPLQVTDAGTAGSPSDLVLTLSAPTIANSGTQTVTATVTALDARRNTMPSVPVSISVDNNAIATASGANTSASGTLTATVGIGADRTNRTITVTAVSAGITRTSQLTVTDSVIVGPPTAADLSLLLSAGSLDNGGTNTITATITAVDSNRNVLTGIPVTVRVDESAIVAVSGTATNGQGVVVASVGIGANRSNRVVTVTAISGALTRSASFAVSGAKLSAAFAPRVSAGASDRVEYTLVDTNSLPMAGQTVDVRTSTGTTVAGRTDTNGKYSFLYTAPTAPGVLTISAVAAGAEREVLVDVSPGTIPAVDSNLTVRSSSLTPTPTVVAVNASATGTNQSDLRALFIGRNSLTLQDSVPVPRVRARFRVLNNDDGSLGAVTWVGGTYAISDDSGLARATFRPGARSSSTDGITVEMCSDRVDFDITTCPNPVRSTLTVVDEALSVNIRTNELIKSGAAQLTYIKEFVVMVVDAAGQAKPDVQITPSIDLTGFYKGFYFWNGEFWQAQYTLAASENYSWDQALRSWKQGAVTTQPVCPNDDVNRNGFLDSGEDLNLNGEIDPRKADVAVKMVGSSRTDANGLAIVQIEYGRNLATWVDFIITVTASGISGTESRARFVGNLYGVGNLPAPGSAFTNENVFPAFGVSPYGRGVVAVPNDAADRCTTAK